MKYLNIHIKFSSIIISLLILKILIIINLDNISKQNNY